MSITIPQLFSQIDKVPKVPEIVRTLISQVNDPNIDFSAVADNVEKEQVISMKVLHLVNSAHYSLPKKVGSIKQALVILGMNELKKLVITSGFINSTSNVPGINLDDFWIDNFRTASYAKWLAEHSKQEHSDMIFTAGLINSFGIILIHLGVPEIAKKIATDIKLGQERIDVEQKYLGFINQKACAELCRQWQFADDLIDTILKSSSPLSFDDISLPACIVSIAKYISESSYSERTQEEILAKFPHKEWQLIGLRNSDIESKIAMMMDLDTGIDGLLD